MDTLRLDCRCGAYLEQRERNPMRLGMAREEFEAQHSGDECAVSDNSPTDECPGKGRCHGCMDWCDRCGNDARKVCDFAECDIHKKGED